LLFFALYLLGSTSEPMHDKVVLHSARSFLQRSEARNSIGHTALVCSLRECSLSGESRLIETSLMLPCTCMQLLYMLCALRQTLAADEVSN
jgi:hypothetical protein